MSDRRPDASLSSTVPFSIASFVQVFGRLALLRGTPVSFRQHLQPSPHFCALTNRHRHLFAGLFGCNRLRATLLLSFVNIYTYTFASLCLGVRSFFCVGGPCPCVPLLIRRESPSFFPLPSIISSSVQDPGGPASFLHASV